jgi:hypothetical protein
MEQPTLTGLSLVFLTLKRQSLLFHINVSLAVINSKIIYLLVFGEKKVKETAQISERN